MERAVWLAISWWTCLDHTCDIGRCTAFLLHVLGSNKAYTQITLRERCSFLTLFLCFICTLMAIKDSPPPRSGAAVVQDPEGVDDWRCWSRKASDQVLYCSSVACNSFCPTLHRTIKRASKRLSWGVSGWMMRMLSWQVASPAGEGWGWSECCAQACAELPWRKGGRGGAYPPWKRWESCLFLPSLSWQVPWKQSVETAENICSRERPLNVFKACCYFYFRPELLSKFVLNQQITSAAPRPHSLANNCIAHKWIQFHQTVMEMLHMARDLCKTGTALEGNKHYAWVQGY